MTRPFAGRSRKCCRAPDATCPTTVATFLCVYFTLCLIPLLVGISFMRMGYRANMTGTIGKLVSATPEKSSGVLVIRQRYQLYPYDVNATSAYCILTRFKEYGSIDQIDATIANQTAYGSTRRLWLDNVKRHICYDNHEVNYYYNGGVICFALSAACFVLLFFYFAMEGFFKFDQCCPPPQQDPIPTEDIEMADIDVGLK
jgi:hypothetical protein